MRRQSSSQKMLAPVTPEEPSFAPDIRGFPRPTRTSCQKWPQTDSLHSALCEPCRKMLQGSRVLQHHSTSHVKTDHEIHQHHLTLDHVWYSASSGCHLCALIWLSTSLAMPRHSQKTEPRHQPPQCPDGVAGSGWNKVHIHVFDPSKFRREEEPYMSLHWKFGFHPLDTSYDLRVYQVEAAAYQARKSLAGIQFRKRIRDEQLNHCMIPRSKSTGSSDSFLLASWWLHSCLDSHKVCSRSWASPRDFPARLLYVGHDTNSTIRVCELIAHIVEEIPKYLTLSHCWGNSRKQQLTRSTLKAYTRAIPAEELSCTLKDAVEITRNLGYQHVWIDSLCIIQDSATDWRTESHKMAGIYGNSQCTIAALASDNDEGGCYRERPAFFGRLVTFPGADGDLQISHPRSRYFEREYEASGLKAAPLHRRAWVVQERALSPRTLYYGSTGLFWECREADASDYDPMGLPYTLRASRSAGKRIMDEIVQPINDTTREQAFHSHWAVLVLLYTGCALSKSEDRQHAIKGFINPIEHKLAFTSVACLWKEYLHTELLWSTPIGAWSRRILQMPTWSWISTAGLARPYYHPWKVHPDEFGIVSAWTWKAEIINYPTNRETLDGDVFSALTIRSSLVKVYSFSFSLGMKWSVELPPFTRRQGAPSRDSRESGEVADEIRTPSWGHWLPDVFHPEDGESIWLLPIFENLRHSAGLVITPKTGDGLGQNEWTRIGFFINNGSNGWFSNLWQLGQNVVNVR
jgi:hypothetical protein